MKGTVEVILTKASWALVFFSAFQTPDLSNIPWQGWAQHEERGSTRLIYFSKTPDDRPWDYSPGQVAIEYGQPVWKQAYAEQFDELTRNNRWRLGQNYWTNLDANFPLLLGSTRVEAGHYYLAVERSGEDGQWSLLLLDPRQTFARRMDAWHVNRKEVPQGIRASLKWEKAEEIADKLQIRFELDSEDQQKATLEIRFGPHRLTTPVKVEF